jgi:hypothetical protein
LEEQSFIPKSKNNINPSWWYVVIGAISLAIEVALVFLLCSLHLSEKDGCLSADGKTDLCYCEAFSGGIIMQTWNSYSALVMSAAGIWVLITLAFPIQPKNRMTSVTFYPFVYGLLAVYLGPGSMFFHGSFTYIGGFLDTTSMYLWLGFILVYNILRVSNLAVYWGIGIYLILEGVLAYLRYTVTEGVDNIFAGLVVITLISEAVVFFCNWGNWIWSSYWWLLGALATFGVAFLIWNLSKTGHPLCYPDYWLQGHAVWHSLSGGVAAMLYQYLRTTSDPQWKFSFSRFQFVKG